MRGPMSLCFLINIRMAGKAWHPLFTLGRFKLDEKIAVDRWVYKMYIMCISCDSTVYTIKKERSAYDNS